MVNDPYGKVDRMNEVNKEMVHIIGLTGGIGSGKSFIARGLSARGYAVYDTDREAKRLIHEDAAVQKALIALFGPEVYSTDGTYQTQHVARRVFEDKSLLQQLNAIVHPAVRRDIEQWKKKISTVHTAQADRKNYQLSIVIESAILFESGFDTLCDKVIVVTAPEELRLRRVIGRDKTDIDKVRARMRAQLNDTELCRRADLVVINDGTKTIEELCQYITQHL